MVWAVLTVAALAAAALSLPLLAHQSLWLDEVYTRAVVGERSLGGIWHHISATESTPPLYYLLAKLSSDLAGSPSAAALRFPSALAVTAAVPVSYLALRRLIGPRAALGAAAMVAVNPYLVFFATDARSYALFVLTGLLSLWGFSAVIENPSRRRYAGWALASAACLWTHYFGAFLIAGEALIVLVVARRTWRPTLAWCVAIAVAAAPLIPLAAHQNGTEDAAFIAGISLPGRVESTLRQFAMGPNVPRSWLEAMGLAILTLGVLAGALTAIRREGARLLLVLGLLALGVPLALAVLGVEDRFYSRNVIVVLPLAAGLAALALDRARAAPLAAYLALCALTAVWVVTNWRYEQADWRTAVARLEATEPAAAVLSTDAGTAAVLSTYLGREPVTGVLSAAVWVAVEPARSAHQRALGPQPVPAGVSAALAAFRPVLELDVRGFRLILERARAPEPIAAASMPGAVLFPGPVRAPRSAP